MGNGQVLTPFRVTGRVGDNCQRQGHDPDCPDRQPVQAVGQVHGVRRRRDDKDDERDVEPSEVQFQVLEKRNRRFRFQGDEARIDPFRIKENHSSHNQPNHHLSHDLVPSNQPLGLFLHDLEIVVQEPDGPEGDGDEQDQDDIAVLNIRPEKRRYHQRREHNQSPHGRRAGFT